MPPGLGALTACPYLSLFFLPFKPQLPSLSLLILALGLPWATSAGSKSSLAGRREELHCLWQSIGQRCPVSLLKQTQRTMGDERPQGGQVKGPPSVGKAPGRLCLLSSFTAHFLGRNWLFLLRLFPVQPERSGLAFGLQHFHRWWSLPCQPSLTFRLDTETKDVRKYTCFGEQFSTVYKDWRNTYHFWKWSFHFWKSVLEKTVYKETYIRRTFAIAQEWRQPTLCREMGKLWFIHTTDKSNFHILRFGEVILALRWINLNFMLTEIACLWPMKHTLHLLSLFLFFSWLIGSQFLTRDWARAMKVQNVNY